jgi:hypothetical protein
MVVLRGLRAGAKRGLQPFYRSAQKLMPINVKSDATLLRARIFNYLTSLQLRAL